MTPTTPTDLSDEGLRELAHDAIYAGCSEWLCEREHSPLCERTYAALRSVRDAARRDVGERAADIILEGWSDPCEGDWSVALLPNEDEAAALQVTVNVCRVLGLDPRVDGDQWCVLYGENLQEGIAGFGSTAELARVAFCSEWIAIRALGEKP